MGLLTRIKYSIYTDFREWYRQEKARDRLIVLPINSGAPIPPDHAVTVVTTCAMGGYPERLVIYSSPDTMQINQITIGRRIQVNFGLDKYNELPGSMFRETAPWTPTAFDKLNPHDEVSVLVTNKWAEPVAFVASLFIRADLRDF